MSDGADNTGILSALDPVNRQALGPVVKAHFIGEDGGDQSRALLDREEQSTVFKTAGVLAPIYDPNVLALIFENSSSLRPNVDAYVTNIDSYGHAYEPVINVESEEAPELIRDALRIENSAEPTDKQVADTLEKLKIEIRAERAMLENFFENCTTDMPFSGPEGLRGLTRQDIEVLGYGYWEVLRNGLNVVDAFNWIPGRTVRLLAVDTQPVEVERQRRVSLLTTKKVKARKRFRRFVQVSETMDKLVYFKEFGDPRALDAVTGKFFQTKEAAETAARTANGTFVPATEILPFKISSTRGPYGTPRWIGTLLAVLGTRQSEEVNFLYFENRSVPPLAVLVSGGRLAEDSTKKLEDFIGNQIRGKRNFHKIMILEAEAGPGADAANGRMKIVLQPLTDAQQKDGLFQAYDERNADKVGQAFRLPRLLRGDVRDFNRSTAEASVDFAEIQVFGPIRQQFDWMMNKMILPALSVKYHRFRSNAPTVRDPEALSKMIKDLVTANVLTPGEGRELAEIVFNRSFEKIRAVWTEQPIGLTLAGRSIEDNLNTDQDESSEFGGADLYSQPGGAGAAAQASGNVDQSKKVKRLAAILSKIHKAMLDEERKDFEVAKTEHVKVPLDLWNQIVTPTNTGNAA